MGRLSLTCWMGNNTHQKCVAFHCNTFFISQLWPVLFFLMMWSVGATTRDSYRLKKLIRKCLSLLGEGVYSVGSLVEDRMKSRMKTILLHCRTKRYSRSFIPAAKRFDYKILECNFIMEFDNSFFNLVGSMLSIYFMVCFFLVFDLLHVFLCDGWCRTIMNNLTYKNKQILLHIFQINIKLFFFLLEAKLPRI